MKCYREITNPYNPNHADCLPPNGHKSSRFGPRIERCLMPDAWSLMPYLMSFPVSSWRKDVAVSDLSPGR